MTELEKFNELAEQQTTVCKHYDATCQPISPESKVGFARRSTADLPVNGLRHPEREDTSGWYIWRGKEMSVEPDFFDSLHSYHLATECPEAIRFLALPPGFRFLVAGDYVDVWFDPALLNID
jgi:hypothetical protein